MTRAKWSSLGLSLLVVVVLVIWMMTGQVKIASTEAPDAPAQEQKTLTRVEVTPVRAELYQPALKLQGQLEPWQSVQVSARVAGTVEQLTVQLGQQVKAGTVLATLSTDGRDAVVRRWRASIRKLEADLAAARKLRASNLAAETEILGLQSELAAARAELAGAELALEHLRPTAPFDAVVNRREVDEGSLVQVGSPLFELVQVNRLKATGRIPQQSAARVQPGQAVGIQLLDGSRLAGVVSFVASAADPDTRSFAVEAIVENPDLKRAAGGSASLSIRLPEQSATFISPAYLGLDGDGRPGVKFVGVDDRVVFEPVQLLSVSTDGAWVAGLPSEIRLITRGAGFVTPGEQVRPVDTSDQRG
ncbi:efflux RND transporter periplasmic adaptor subunit [Marinobacter sp. VGCF2001]|uniref:efflux RND transporter periplasmic adaptor subunit n=1 Tax=Marinobacter sp. VGCF2001 TaxID=3417189 RepID=UPI003CEFB249